MGIKYTIIKMQTEEHSTASAIERWWRECKMSIVVASDYLHCSIATNRKVSYYFR